MSQSPFHIRNPKGFQEKYNLITDMKEVKHDTGIRFAILNLQAGEEYSIDPRYESAAMLVTGELAFFDENKQAYFGKREDIFEEDPFAIHASRDSMISLKAETNCEIMVFQTENDKKFPTVFYNSDNMLESERRGKGLLGDTAYRIVRTIFDDRNNKDANLVLGEVITFPGCWSSYPPHHHAQPEIYHYRFTEPQGYGHGELGDDVLKVQHNDTVKILEERDHAQTAAPGYGMYYMWVIRHLAGNRYDVPEFTEAHNWTRTSEANQRVWQPKNK